MLELIAMYASVMLHYLLPANLLPFCISRYVTLMPLEHNTICKPPLAPGLLGGRSKEWIGETVLRAVYIGMYLLQKVYQFTHQHRQSYLINHQK